MAPLQVFVDGVGVYGPGLNGWSQSKNVLNGSDVYLPGPLQLPQIDSLPSAERRRLGLVIKLALASAADATRAGHWPPSQLTSVFASSTGDGDNCHQMLEGLASAQRAISPTRFHNSVHNAPAGYWSIASGSQCPSTSLSAHDATFAAGLLEAVSQVCCQQQPCLLVAYDAPYPQPLHAARPVAAAFGVALLLAPARGAGSLAALTLHHQQVLPAATGQDLFADATLESLQWQAPAARALPLLAALARTGQAAAKSVLIDFLPGQQLCIGVGA